MFLRAIVLGLAKEIWETHGSRLVPRVFGGDLFGASCDPCSGAWNTLGTRWNARVSARYPLFGTFRGVLHMCAVRNHLLLMRVSLLSTTGKNGGIQGGVCGLW